MSRVSSFWLHAARRPPAPISAICRFPRAMPRPCLLVILSLLIAGARAEPWTSSHVQGNPEPPHPYIVERVFAKVRLNNVTDMVLAPGLAQWLIAENEGKVWSLPDDP